MDMYVQTEEGTQTTLTIFRYAPVTNVWTTFGGEQCKTNKVLTECD